MALCIWALLAGIGRLYSVRIQQPEPRQWRLHAGGVLDSASSEESVGDARLGNLPSAWYSAISVTWKVRKPQDFRMVSLALLLRPSTTPLESCFLARK